MASRKHWSGGMISVIVFSKDRALQLDLTLNSIKRNFKQASEVLVIFQTSTEHVQSYQILQKEYPDTHFISQSKEGNGGLFGDIEKAISNARQEYICFFTDDDIVYSPVEFSVSALEGLFKNPWTRNGAHFSCLSLRLGSNIRKRDYGDGILRDDNMPIRERNDPFLTWNRTTIPVGGYWSYPLSVDGHVFRKKDVRQFAKELNILNSSGAFDWKQTPNEFEAKLQRFWFDIPPLMASVKTSCVVNSPNNRVQDTIENRHGDEFSYDAQFLNEKFLGGHRINIDHIDFPEIVCPHQELDILRGLI